MRAFFARAAGPAKLCERHGFLRENVSFINQFRTPLFVRCSAGINTARQL